MKKFLVLFASVSVLALAGCNQAEEKAAEPAATTAPAAEPAPAAPAAAEPAPAAPAAEPAPAAPATGAIDPAVQTMIDQTKAAAAAMTPEQKTQAVAGIRTAAEGAATAAGQDAKAAGDAAEAAAKAALGL
ncbi:MAG: hypothetical protein ACRCU5_03275 [Rhizobiaceae bacterium]